MRTQNAVATLIWVLSTAQGIRQGMGLSLAGSTSEPFGAFGVLAALMPLLFFSSAPFWIRGHPFDVGRTWVNEKFGAEVFESYTRAIRPLALLATVAAVIGLTSLVVALNSDYASGAYEMTVLYLSFAVGCTAYRAFLRRRGDTIE